MIKPSDKGGYIVIMDNLFYNSMSMRVLFNTDWYLPVSPDHYQGIESDY